MDEIIVIALEQLAGNRPKIVSDNASQFVAKEWREVIRHFAKPKSTTFTGPKSFWEKGGA